MAPETAKAAVMAEPFKYPNAAALLEAEIAPLIQATGNTKGKPTDEEREYQRQCYNRSPVVAARIKAAERRRAAVLAALETMGKARATEINKQLPGMKIQSVTNALCRLKERGLVEAEYHVWQLRKNT